MNAVIKKAAALKTVAALYAEVEALERSLALAERTRDTARAANARLIFEGDDGALTANKRTMELADRDASRLVAQLQDTRDALRLAEERDRVEARRASYAAIREQSRLTREAVEHLDKALTAFARAYPAARVAIEKLDKVLLDNGVDAADPLQLKARLRGLAERALWMHSDGIFGQPNALDSIDQLRSNGRASLRLAVQEFIEVTLRRSRGRLGVEN